MGGKHALFNTACQCSKKNHSGHITKPKARDAFVMKKSNLRDFILKKNSTTNQRTKKPFREEFA